MSSCNLINFKDINEKILEAGVAESEGRQFMETKGSGVALVKNISKGTTSTGKPKFSGVLANKEEAKFNVWSNSAAFHTLSDAQIVPGETFVSVSYSVSKFGFVLDALEIIEDPDLKPDDFIKQRYVVAEKSLELLDLLEKSGISNNGKDVIKAVLGINEKSGIMYERFPVEYAALSHHDNCKTGLFAHSIKCLRIYNGIKDIYANIFGDPRVNDLMVIGLIIHDCGKVFEMYNGTYQKNSCVTHRGLGLEHLFQFKDIIIEKYDEEFYYMLFSIIQQHHGEYGEGARTLYALITHIIDDIEATLSSIDEMIEGQQYTSDIAGKKIRFNDSYYTIL